MRKIFWPLTIVAAVVLFVALALMVATTDFANRWVVEKVIGRAVDSVKVGHIKGNAWSTLYFYDADIRSSDHQAIIREGHLRFDLWGLLSRQYKLRRLFLKGITYSGPPIQKTVTHYSEEPIRHGFLKKPLILEYARFEEITIVQEARTYDLSSIELKGSANANGIRMDALTVQMEKIFISLQGETTFQPSYGFHGKLRWRIELPNEETTRGACNFNGNLRQVALKIAVTDPVVLKTEATLHIAQDWTRLTLVGDPVAFANNAASDASSSPNELAGRPDSNGIPGKVSETKAIDGRERRKNGEGTIFPDESNCISLQDVQTRVFDGLVNLKGLVCLGPPTRLALTIDGMNIDPSLKWPEWPGRFSLRTDVKAALGEKPTFRLIGIGLAGELLNQPFQASGNLDILNGGPVFENFVVLSGQSSITVKGGLGAVGGLNFHARLIDPEKLWPHVGGNVNVFGAVTMDGSNVLGSATIDGSPASYGHLAAEKMQGSLKYDSTKGEILTSQIEMRHLRVGQERLLGFDLSWKGNLQEHRLMAKVEGVSDVAVLKVKGSYDASSWKARVEKVSFDSNAFGEWHLAKNFDVFVDHTQITPFETCWSRNDQTACVWSSYGNETGWDFEGDAKMIPLQWLNTLFLEAARYPTKDEGAQSP